jgi:hypothetical protein
LTDVRSKTIREMTYMSVNLGSGTVALRRPREDLAAYPCFV